MAQWPLARSTFKYFNKRRLWPSQDLVFAASACVPKEYFMYWLPLATIGVLAVMPAAKTSGSHCL
jgi:hypothetical protein